MPNLAACLKIILTGRTCASARICTKYMYLCPHPLHPEATPSHSMSPVSILKPDCHKMLSLEIVLARATPILVSVLVFGQHQTVFDGFGISQVCYTSKNSVNCVLLYVGFGRNF